MKVLFSLLVLFGLGSTFLFYVWGQVDVVRVGYELEQLSKEKLKLEQEHDRLQILYSQLTAPDRIAREASVKLGMKPPNPGQVILVSIENQPDMQPPDNVESFRVAQRTFTMKER